MKVSIIIVHYKVKKKLFFCLDSIFRSKQKTTFEVLVIDNDEEKTIARSLKEKYPRVTYIPSKKNKGFGAGNNLGASSAKGEIFFFLNPDTEIYDFTIDHLLALIENNQDVGIVAPLLLNKELKPYPLQGSTQLTLFNALVTLSFINRLFPRNSIAKRHFLKSWNKKQKKEVDVVPGTAFMVRKNLFNEIRGFDEKFFLYFEEHDFCKRVKEKGFKLYILPKAKVMHHWESSTKHLHNKNVIFRKSRFYYFRKHFGILFALLIETILRITKKTLIVPLIFSTIFLYIYNIHKWMVFIGDQGWFYLSARDMVLTGTVPLVGITSSHTWLHQGPLWTYILAGIFALTNCHPIAPAVFSAIITTFTVWVFYKVSGEMFSEHVGLTAAFLYATSPLVILHARMPYHTTPMPLLTILFIFCLYKWIQGKVLYFPFAILCLTLLYNFELATIVLWFPFIAIFGYGIYKKKKWVSALRNKKIIVLSLLFLFLPMLPILIYDFQNGFPQTVKFTAWLGYRVLRFFGFPSIHGNITGFDTMSMVTLTLGYIQRLLFLPHIVGAILLFVGATSYLFWFTVVKIRRKTISASQLLLFLWFTVTVGSYLANKTPSEAYLPMIYPAIILSLAFLFHWLMQKRYLFIPIVVLVVCIGVLNMYTLIQNDYFMGTKKGYGPSMEERIAAAKQIVKESEKKEYTIIGEGEGSQFQSFTMNTEYLTWWLGHGPSQEKEKLQFVIYEDSNSIIVEKKRK